MSRITIDLKYIATPIFGGAAAIGYLGLHEAAFADRIIGAFATGIGTAFLGTASTLLGFLGTGAVTAMGSAILGADEQESKGYGVIAGYIGMVGFGIWGTYGSYNMMQNFISTQIGLN